MVFCHAAGRGDGKGSHKMQDGAGPTTRGQSSFHDQD